MKSTLIVPVTLLATLAAGVLVHDWLRTKPSVEDAAPTRTGSIAANPDTPVTVSPAPVSAPVQAFIEDVAPTQTASISTANPNASAPVSLASASAPPPSATPKPEPPQRMTASQQASLDAWMIKTYLACWKPAAQPADASPYVARVRLEFKPDGSLLKPPKLVNPPSDPAQKPQAKSVLHAVKACDPLQVPAQYRSFYGQWKTRTIHFDPRVAAR